MDLLHLLSTFNILCVILVFVRQQLETLKRVHKKEVAIIKAALREASKPICDKCDTHDTGVTDQTPGTRRFASNDEHQPGI